jgi:hypothetical protein
MRAGKAHSACLRRQTRFPCTRNYCMAAAGDLYICVHKSARVRRSCAIRAAPTQNGLKLAPPHA